MSAMPLPHCPLGRGRKFPIIVDVAILCRQKWLPVYEVTALCKQTAIYLFNLGHDAFSISKIHSLWSAPNPILSAVPALPCRIEEAAL